MYANFGVFILVWESLTVVAALAVKVATMEGTSPDTVLLMAGWMSPLALIATYGTCRGLDRLDRTSSGSGAPPAGAGVVRTAACR